MSDRDIKPDNPTDPACADARWLTRAAFQARFGIGHALQRKLEKQGRLTSLRLGHRTVRLDAESFDRLGPQGGAHPSGVAWVRLAGRAARRPRSPSRRRSPRATLRANRRRHPAFPGSAFFVAFVAFFDVFFAMDIESGLADVVRVGKSIEEKLDTIIALLEARADR